MGDSVKCMASDFDVFKITFDDVMESHLPILYLCDFFHFAKCCLMTCSISIVGSFLAHLNWRRITKLNWFKSSAYGVCNQSTMEVYPS
jgi:hypothetical protein